MLSLFFHLVLVLALPTLISSCSCLDEISLQTSIGRVDSVFRGTVLRQLRNVDDYSNYVVLVSRVFKGCNFKANERIVVKTGSEESVCGVALKVNSTYAFSGYTSSIDSVIKKDLDSGSNVKKAGSVGSCDYNLPWSQVSSADSALLRNYDNSKCVAKCTTGIDCLKTHYCDSGTCVAFNKPCPKPLVKCAVAPCSLATPCSVSSSKCNNDYCGGCKSFFLDSSTTRVCKY
jgi:Tissue inhibitor of metalloproteinase